MKIFNYTKTILLSTSICVFALQPYARAEDFTEIPVIINLLKGSGATEDDAKKAVEEASKILKQAEIKLTVLKVNKDVVVAPDDDAALTKDERVKVREAGGKEIGKTDNKKGIKITFAKTAKSEQPNTPGVSVHRDPTLIATRRTDTTAQTGIVIAHEIGHILTIPGHTDDPKNLMNPVEPPGGNTNLTADQIAELKKGAPNHGKSVKKENPKDTGTKREQQYGSVTDDLEDASGSGGPYLDLYRAMFESETGHGDINAVLSLGGVFPLNQSFDATYRLLFNTDGLDTGVAINGIQGIDREASLSIVGTGAGGNLQTSGKIIDYIGGTESVLPVAPVLAHEPELDGSSEPIEDQLLVSLPKSLLGLTADQVMMNVLSEDGSGIHDVMFLIFDQSRYAKDASLKLFQGEVFANRMLPFQISGLTPDSLFNFFIDENLLFSDVLDSAGAFSGSFLFPDLPGNRNYFLTAQDATGEFAFNVVFVSEPPLLTLFVLGALGLLVRKVNSTDDRKRINRTVHKQAR